MIRLFISHNQKDKELVGKFIRALGRVLPEKDKAGELSLFCSSVAGLGIEAGGDLTSRLRAELKDSDFVVVFVTANYLRSVYCLAEWSVCWYAEKKVLPLVYDRAAYEELLKIVGRTLICVDMDNRANRAEELFAALKNFCPSPRTESGFTRRSAVLSRRARRTRTCRTSGAAKNTARSTPIAKNTASAASATPRSRRMNGEKICRTPGS